MQLSCSVKQIFSHGEVKIIAVHAEIAVESKIAVQTVLLFLKSGIPFRSVLQRLARR
jgi:hypothetical protein